MVLENSPQTFKVTYKDQATFSGAHRICDMVARDGATFQDPRIRGTHAS